jgi:hypothetical protein
LEPVSAETPRKSDFHQLPTEDGSWGAVRRPRRCPRNRISNADPPGPRYVCPTSTIRKTLSSKAWDRRHPSAPTGPPSRISFSWYCSEPRLAFGRTVVLRYRYASTQHTQQFISSVEERLRRIPGIVQVATVNGLPLDRGLNTSGGPAAHRELIKISEALYNTWLFSQLRHNGSCRGGHLRCRYRCNSACSSYQ